MGAVILKQVKRFFRNIPVSTGAGRCQRSNRAGWFPFAAGLLFNKNTFPENLAARKTFVNFIKERMELGASSSADVIRAEAKVGAALGTVSASLALLHAHHAQVEHE